MTARIAGRGFATALDVGCGEGRFCRMMQTAGIATVGIDPTPARSNEPIATAAIERRTRRLHDPLTGNSEYRRR
jgi:2-polyprenyl-3-methyl-5-hydroxy-6-metoxy-1,4-benzoquinol methylase